MPTIAAVNGPAIGAGCDLACMCDIRIASENATFAESFVKLGIVPGDGGAWLLPRVVGMSKAAEMAFTGDTIERAEALDVRPGVAGRARRAPDARGARARRAHRRQSRRTALRLTKRLLREGQHTRLETLLEMSAALPGARAQDGGPREAVNAFVEKRKPDFSGRLGRRRATACFTNRGPPPCSSWR